MDRPVSTTIVIVVLLLALALMAFSWRRRKNRQAGLDLITPVPEALGAQLAAASGLYLATTPAGDRLNRVAVGGLGFRARLTVIVTEAGIVLPFPGASDVFIPTPAIVSVDTASWTIDRGIEPGGLVAITWTLGDTVVDSYFRFDEPTPVLGAIRSLIPATKESESQ